MFQYFKVTIMMIVFGNFMLLYTHAYEIENGMILYDIQGGGVLTNETNLTLKGSATLRFKDWGTTQLTQEKAVVETTGALQSKQEISSMQKQTGELVFTVDYLNKKVHKRKHSISNAFIEHDTQGLEKTEQQRVQGLLCDVWEGQGVRKCIYKGLALKIESESLGLFYRKVAVDVHFDINVSSIQCTIPDYPREEFGLFKSNLKTKNETKAECFTEALKNVAYTLEQKVLKNKYRLGIDKKEKTTFLNKIGQKIYEYQKTVLPERLKSLKETRECLQSVDNPFDTDLCIEYFTRFKENLGRDKNDFNMLWDDENKTVLMDKIEDLVYDLQARLPCIERAKNITDLSTCMK